MCWSLEACLRKPFQSSLRFGLWAVMVAILASAAHADPVVQAMALVKGRAALSIDGKRRTLLVGATSPEGVKLIAADAQVATIEISGRRFELHLDQRIGSAFAAAPKAKALLLAPGAHGSYLVDGAINGNPVSFIVDTGASMVAINKHTARQLGLMYRTDGRLGQVETASGVVAAYYVHFAKVKVRTLELNNVEGLVVDGEYPTTALLGQSFLNRLDMRRNGLLLELKER